MPTGRVSVEKARLKRATRLAEIVLEALDRYAPAQRAAKLREHKLLLANGPTSLSSQAAPPAKLTGPQRISARQGKARPS